MEEDIKILKNIIERDFSNPMGWSGYYDCELKELQQAIKHLIKAYKEISELYKSEKKMKNQYVELYQDILLKENVIPVSLVKEKIEELNKEEKQNLKGTKGQDRYFVKQMYQNKRKVLEELLEKRK